MLDETKFPHFIPDKPQGEDVFEGKSQEHLAASICNYIKSIDAKPDNDDGLNIPRIIGLEGGWGTGKSNVVNMIGGELSKVGYYTFTYDAWGHQEDLQRRSILETLTSELTSNEVLTGKVTIKTRTGVSFTDTWKKQLQLLLSNKTIIQSHSVPSLSWAAIWAVTIAAVYGICISVADKIIGDECPLSNNWWIYGIPVVLAIIVGIGYLIKDKGSLKNAMKMVNKSEEDTTTFQYTSSEEPSVAEFKNWMKAISDYLGSDKKRRNKKLIIVFDNMDRLPSEKVMQLWSCIYTFFTGGEFENIWTIIPYDYKHLCQAINGAASDSDDNSRIKRFIDKTFPITYIVPQPVITDYEKLFYTYFDKAFGEKEHDRKHISQVFMCLKKNPNPRTVISFVNELVALRMQWPDSSKYRLQNLALFVLKKDYLFYNDGINDSNATLETNLLSEDLYKDIAHYYPDQDGHIRRQICQFAYGLEDEKLAGELPLRLELQRLLSEGSSIKDYASQPNFVAILEKVLSDSKVKDVDNIVKCMQSLDGVDFGEEQASIQSKWDMLANHKVATKYSKHEYDATLDILIKHSTEKRVKDLTRSFCQGMHKIKIEKGDSYYEALHSLKVALESINSKITLFDFVIPTTTTPEHFVEFLKKAGKEYRNYKLTVDNQELNNYLFNNAVSGDETSAVIFEQLTGDDNYSFIYLRDYLSKKIVADEIKNDISAAAYINRKLSSDEGIIKIRFNASTVSTFVDAAKKPWNDHSSLGSEDVIAMYLADGNDLPNVEDTMLPRLSGCVEKYITSDDLLKHRGSSGTAFNKINAYMVKNKKGDDFDIPYFAENILIISEELGLDIKTLLDYSNDYEFEEIEDLSASNIQKYLHQELFADYLASPGLFTKGLINQGVSILKTQEAGLLAKIGPQATNSRVEQLYVNQYWKQFVLTFVGTEYIPKLNAQLTNELITMLRRIADSNTVEDKELLEFMLGHQPVDTLLREYLNNEMNNRFTKTDITPLKFKVFGGLLPVLTPDMDANTARNLSLHLIKPIYMGKDCAHIIVENKDFYLGLMRKEAPSVQDILKGMLDNADTKAIYAPIKEEIEILLIPEEENESSEQE